MPHQRITRVRWDRGVFIENIHFIRLESKKLQEINQKPSILQGVNIFYPVLYLRNLQHVF